MSRIQVLVTLRELEAIVAALPAGRLAVELANLLEARRVRELGQRKARRESAADARLRAATMGGYRAAHYLGVVGTTLGQWRKRGTGPRFERLSAHKRRPGAARYRKEDLDAFQATRSEYRQGQSRDAIERRKAYEIRVYGKERGLPPDWG